MANLSAVPVTFAGLLKVAVDGDVIALAGGDYGPLAIARRTYDPPLTIRSADPSRPAKFTRVTVNGGGGVDLKDLVFAFEPDEATVASTSVVQLNGTTRINIKGGEIYSGPAVNGVPELAESGDKTGNVLGWPTCRGAWISNSSDITIESVDLHHLHRGMVLGSSQRISIIDCDFHHIRKTGILGGADELLIARNHLHSFRPWRYGETKKNGDHGDWFALWTDAKGFTRLVIEDNFMETGDGARMIGGWIAGKSGLIDTWRLSNNLLIGGVVQGFMAGGPGAGVRYGRITDNVFLQDDPTGKPLGVILQKSAMDTIVENNFIGSISDKSQTGANTISTKVDLAKVAALRAAWHWQRRGGPPTPHAVVPVTAGTLSLGEKVYDVGLQEG